MESSNIPFSSEKSNLVWIRRKICTDQPQFTSQNSSKQISWWILIWEDNRRWTFSLEEAILWIMDTGIVYCYVFINCYSDGTHSLQRIHWWASDVMLNFSRSVQMKKQTHLQYILDGLRVKYTFKSVCQKQLCFFSRLWLKCSIHMVSILQCLYELFWSIKKF